MRPRQRCNYRANVQLMSEIGGCHQKNFLVFFNIIVNIGNLKYFSVRSFNFFKSLHIKNLISNLQIFENIHAGRKRFLLAGRP